jgi:2-furoyl-CoA dehydrogenase FAD binding subunit
MKPAAFDYVRVDSADEAVALLTEYGDDASILAGGQSLMPMLNMRLSQPRVVIDISRAQDLSPAYERDGALEVAAAVTQAVLEQRPRLADEVPLLVQAFPHLGHFQTRNRGTVCGSIAHADPSAELPLCLAALDGEVLLRSSVRRRAVRAEAFFLGALSTAREPDELIEAVRFPLARSGVRYGFAEVSMRHGDFAIVALAAAVSAAQIVLAVGGVADRPWVQRWPRLADRDIEDALHRLASEIGARDDQHASAAYRRHLVRTLGRRLLEELQR